MAVCLTWAWATALNALHHNTFIIKNEMSVQHNEQVIQQPHGNEFTTRLGHSESDLHSE